MPPTNLTEEDNLSDDQPMHRSRDVRAVAGVVSVSVVSCGAMAAITMGASFYPTIGIFLLSVLFIAIISIPKDA